MSLVIFCSSCSHNIYIPVIHAGDVALSADTDTLLIVDNTIPKSSSLSKVEKTIEGISLGKVTLNSIEKKDETFNTMLKFVSLHERFSLSHDQVITMGSGANNEPIEKNVIDSLCKLYKADGVISLESIQSSSSGGAPQGSTSHSTLKTTWRMNSESGAEVDNTIITTSGNLQSNEIFDLENGKKVIHSASSEAAIIYLRRIAPCEYREQRFYYYKGTEEFKSADKAMKLGDYKLAKFCWEQMLDQKETKKKTLRRLAHNLALIHELEGDFQMALVWAERAVDKGNAPSLSYMKILIDLVDEQPLIEYQMLRE